MILIDSHVHIHDGIKFGELFTFSMRNFDVAGKRYLNSDERTYQRVLCLTETQDVSKFQELSSQSAIQEGELQGWNVTETSEDDSLLISHPVHGEMIVIAGRQIVTAERLEVLAIGTSRRILDGCPIAEVIEKVQNQQALAVIPWGFGKWIGKRGAVLGRVLGRAFQQPVFLGDNSGRPRIWPDPPQFVEARKCGMRILPGSDPLPFLSEYRRIGSFGFVMEETIGNINPAADIKHLLLDKRRAVHPYGQLENPFRFLRNQLAMQYRIRVGIR